MTDAVGGVDGLIAAVKQVELGLLALPGINGVGVGLREADGRIGSDIAVKILVEDAQDLPPGLPSSIAGTDVCIVERRYVPLVNPDRRRYQQLRGGICIEHPDFGLGTMGAIVQDLTVVGATARLGLSCFHVAGGPGSAFPQTVWQAQSPPILGFPSPPPAHDDHLGGVVRAVFPNTRAPTVAPLFFDTVDAAVFELRDPLVQPPRMLSAAIIGQDEQASPLSLRITATRDPVLGDEVSKRGAATRVTHGRVVAPYMSAAWKAHSLTGDRVILASMEILRNSDLTPGPFADESDSGALVVDRFSPGTALGLLWGGDQNNWSLMTPIKTVESRLKISFVLP